MSKIYKFFRLPQLNKPVELQAANKKKLHIFKLKIVKISYTVLKISSTKINQFLGAVSVYKSYKSVAKEKHLRYSKNQDFTGQYSIDTCHLITFRTRIFQVGSILKNIQNEAYVHSEKCYKNNVYLFFV